MNAAQNTTEHFGRLDAVGLPWLVSVRWAGVLAQLGAVVAGTEGFAGATTLTIQMGLIGALAASNVWLSWRLTQRLPLKMSVGGWLVSADVVVLSWLLRESGAVLNPVSVFYLVDIVLAALVLDRIWAWIITSLSIAGYGMLFLAPSAELAAAGAMHPEIGEHVRGMWLAFAGTALIVAILVSRLASMIERRDQALAQLRERSARDARLASLTTLSAGAAHELSTPLATIAVAARELELALVRNGANAEWQADAQLIRSEVERCRHVLHDMSARLSQPIGEVAVAQPLRDVIDATMTQLAPPHRARVTWTTDTDVTVVWPAGVVTRALVNIVRNAIQASNQGESVSVRAARTNGGRVTIVVEDRGSGMRADVLARAGEPFYTTKPQGDGTGLGLFVARSTVEQLGGALAITSIEGRGTTVTITLPASVPFPGAS